MAKKTWSKNNANNSLREKHSFFILSIPFQKKIHKKRGFLQKDF